MNEHSYDDGIVLEEPPPITVGGSLQRLLREVRESHPGQWARIRHYTERRSAYAAARRLNACAEWEAETRPSDRKGRWLYVRFTEDPSSPQPIRGSI